MYLQVKSNSGITLVPSETKLLDTRTVFLEDEINSESACEFYKTIMILCAQDKNKPINLMINSCGGGINSGLLIYDVIQSCKVPIRTCCMGRAYSMAAIIFAGGTAGRYMFPNSELMLHEPLLGNKVEGNASSIRSISDSLLESKEKLTSIIIKHTGRTKEEVEKAISYDHYYTPEESIEFGLADKIIGFDDVLQEVNL